MVQDMGTALTKVGKRHDIAGLVVLPALVRHPDLNLVDRYTAGDVGDLRHGVLVFVAEEETEEEVAVLIVGIARDIELRHLCATLAANRLALAVLLADKGLDTQFAELQIGLDTEKCLTARNKGRVQIHRHIPRLNGLDDVILLPLVGEFEVLLIERETGFGIVIEVEIQFIAHLAIDIDLYLLIEIEDVVVAGTDGKTRVAYILVLEAEEQLGRTLHLELHAAGAKDLVGRTDIEFHIGDVEFLLVVMLYLAYLLLPVAVHHLLLDIGTIFLGRHEVRRSNVRITYTGVHYIAARSRVVGNLRHDITRCLERKARPGTNQLIVVVHAERIDLHWCPDRTVLQCLFGRDRGGFHRGRIVRRRRILRGLLLRRLLCHTAVVTLARDKRLTGLRPKRKRQEKS